MSQDILASLTIGSSEYTYIIVPETQEFPTRHGYRIHMNVNGGHFESAGLGWTLNRESALERLALDLAHTVYSGRGTVQIYSDELQAFYKTEMDRLEWEEAEKERKRKIEQEEAKQYSESRKKRISQIKDYKWKKVNDFKIEVASGKISIPAIVLAGSGLGIHKYPDSKGKYYAISHQGTGLRVATGFNSLVEAKVAVDRLAHAFNWNLTKEKMMEDKKERAEFIRKMERDVFENPPHDRKFKDLAVGDIFIFESEEKFPFSGLAKGPWIKTRSSRGYAKYDPETSEVSDTIYRVGSINAIVKVQGKKPYLMGNPPRDRKFIEWTRKPRGTLMTNIDGWEFSVWKFFHPIKGKGYSWNVQDPNGRYVAVGHEQTEDSAMEKALHHYGEFVEDENPTPLGKKRTFSGWAVMDMEKIEQRGEEYWKDRAPFARYHVIAYVPGLREDAILDRFVRRKDAVSFARSRETENPPLSWNNPPATEVYRDIIQIKARKKDGRLYKHDFQPGSSIYGLSDGSLLIKSRKGKKLWRIFAEREK